MTTLPALGNFTSSHLRRKVEDLTSLNGVMNGLLDVPELVRKVGLRVYSARIGIRKKIFSM